MKKIYNVNSYEIIETLYREDLLKFFKDSDELPYDEEKIDDLIASSQKNPPAEAFEIVSGVDLDAANAAFDRHAPDATLQGGGNIYYLTITWIEMDEVTFDEDGDEEDFVTVSAKYPSFSIIMDEHKNRPSEPRIIW